MADSGLNNLVNLDTSAIFQPEVFEDVKYRSFYFIESIDHEGAVSYAMALEKILEKVASQSKESSAMYEILRFWMLRLYVFGFDCLSAQDKTDLLKKFAIEILEKDLDFKEAIFSYIDIFESGSAVTEQTKDFIRGLTVSQVLFGSNIDAFKKNNFQPSVSNWIKQYQYSINKRDLNVTPGAFDMVNFINNDNNVKNLNSKELEILKRLLELYNWLLNPIIYVDQKSSARNASSYANIQRFELPKEVLKPLSVSLPPVVPVPKNLPEQREMEEVRQISNESITSPSPSLERRGMGAGVGTLRIDTTDMSAMPSRVHPVESSSGGSAPQTFNRVNFQDVLKNRDQEVGIGNQGDAVAGLRMGGGSKQIPNSQLPISNGDKGGKNSPGPSLEKRGEETRSSPSSYILNPLLEKKPVLPQSGQSKQEEIDRKLEELKKKVK